MGHCGVGKTNFINNACNTVIHVMTLEMLEEVLQETLSMKM